VSMRGLILQLSRPLVILIVRSVVVSSRHHVTSILDLYWHEWGHCTPSVSAS
jgi:hypothetical protein